MSRVELLLTAMDETYDRVFTRLRGTTDEEYRWEPVPDCWTVRQQPDGTWATDYAFPDPVPAPFTTLGWRLLHIADCKIMYHEYAYGPGKLTFPELAAPTTVAAAVARLEEGQALLRGDLATLADPDLDTQVRTNWGELWPAWRIFWTMIHHDAHHGAEIGCLRDLYRGAAGNDVR
jgi:hypothetical protein